MGGSKFPVGETNPESIHYISTLTSLVRAWASCMGFWDKQLLGGYRLKSVQMTGIRETEDPLQKTENSCRYHLDLVLLIMWYTSFSKIFLFRCQSNL